MGKLLMALVVLIIAWSVAPEAKGSWFTPRFDWLPSECAHKRYPMRLIQGNLLLKDGSSLYVPAKAIIDNGWGELGSTHVVGSQMKSLPVKLKATWFSFAEDKFFTGEFTLPYDLILYHFKKGIVSPRSGKRTTYSRMFVGFGPEGAVSVWIAVDRVILEVAKYKGTETTLPWKAVTSSEMPREEYIARILADGRTEQELHELKEHGVPIGFSDYHSTRYPLTNAVSGQRNQTVWLRTLNGEREYFDFSDAPGSRTSRALPVSVEVDWENHVAQKYVAYMKFDESEITAAFGKLMEKNGGHPMQLKLEISDDPQVIHTSLNDGTYIVKLNKTVSKTFTRR